MSKTAILGATGPTGFHLAAALRANGMQVRVVARGMDKLVRMFPDEEIEKRNADLTQADEALRATEGCDLVYDCLGFPGDQMHLHPVSARHIARALERGGARCLQVSSYWAYYPQVREVMDESHPRRGGAPWVTFRREAEDILLAAGAGILHLPDFYGPQVHVSTLQNALVEAAQGKTVNWLGRTDVAREYIYVPDAMRIAAALGSRAEAAGQHWCLPGSGPLTGSEVAAIATRHFGRKVALRSAGLLMLRVVSLFKPDVRGLMQVAPNYMKPVRYDAGKLERLIGRPTMTSYDAGIGETLKSLQPAH